jgi:flavin reductase (DIM6/NTAB) family NADH-FMN oxidoreductase RutF
VSITGFGRQDIDTRALRNTLSRFATGVTLVTCCDPNGRFVGLTVSSFNSLSLDPPLVLWSLYERSPSLQAFLAAPSFAVNVLAESQVGLSQRFSGGELDRFAEGAWSLGTHGAPILAGSCAVLQCRSETHQEAGDHRLFIGRVLHGSHSDLPPLIFHSSHYRRLGDRL